MFNGLAHNPSKFKVWVRIPNTAPMKCKHEIEIEECLKCFGSVLLTLDRFEQCKCPNDWTGPHASWPECPLDKEERSYCEKC